MSYLTDLQISARENSGRCDIHSSDIRHANEWYLPSELQDVSTTLWREHVEECDHHDQHVGSRQRTDWQGA